MKRLGLYIHIPFCIKKCKYCGFVSFDNCSKTDWEEYFSALMKEIEIRAAEYGDYEVDTIFIGGGTPTILPGEKIAELLNFVKNKFNMSVNHEITIEANPGTLAPEKLEIYRVSGINRLSIGVQSLDNRCLTAIGRIHDRDVFLDTYREARKAGFDNINLDLMFSIPEQTDEIWEATVREAIELAPEHISFYSLQIEEGTEFYDMYKNGTLEIADDEADRARYHIAAEILRDAGYHHYEISNAALPGYESVHNTKYWSLDEYLGMGLAAHSFAGGIRFYNTSDLKEYKESLALGRLASVEDEVCTREDLIFEYTFTGLRKTEGISLSDFESRFGIAFDDYYRDKMAYIAQEIERGFMFREGDYLGLTIKGIDISNDIMAEFS